MTPGLPPKVRVDGDVRALDYEPFTPGATREAVYEILSDGQRQRLENEWELDLSYTLPGSARFRVNVYFQKGTVGAALRVIPNDIKTLGKLGLPGAVESMTERPRGLVLVTGPTENAAVKTR